MSDGYDIYRIKVPDTDITRFGSAYTGFTFYTNAKKDELSIREATKYATREGATELFIYFNAFDLYDRLVPNSVAIYGKPQKKK